MHLQPLLTPLALVRAAQVLEALAPLDRSHYANSKTMLTTLSSDINEEQ